LRKEQFIRFIEEPALQQGESVALLSQLTKQFPYCQTAQLLLAKALHNENSIGYSDQIKVAAAYASDRKVLYQLILSKPPAPVVKKEIPAITIAIPENDTELLNNLVVSAEANIEDAKPIEQPAEALEERTAKVEIPEVSREAAEIKEEITVPPAELPGGGEKKEDELQPENLTEQIGSETRISQTETPVNVDELPLLEKNIIVEAIDASIELEVAENMPFKEEESNTEEKKEEQEADSEQPAENDINIEHKEPEDEFDPDKTYTFTEWLRLSKKIKNNGTVKKAEKQQESGAKEEKHDRRSTIDHLIDKFISEEPKITRPSPKQEFFSPVNIARKSVQDDDEFVTETLANIYLKQGSYAKALKAYETLSLKFPEKKLYFAARIKEIKKIIKDHK
jgi:hypothetical protein